MGEVFLAYDERLFRKVAIKQLHADAQLTAERRVRLLREAQAVALLNHPSIVHVYDIVTLDNVDHVVMEYIDGIPLTRHFADGPLPLPQALALAIQIAQGLGEAHSKGIIHRDLKADNILVTAGVQAKILDFGLAKQLWDVHRRADAPKDETANAGETKEERISVEGGLIGTCTAMSPEQASGQPLDHRSDLFSFGTLLYELVTGRPPFTGATPLAILHQIIHDPHPPASRWNPAVPPLLLELIDQLLAKEVAARPQNAALVVARLEQIAAQVPAEVPAASWAAAVATSRAAPVWHNHTTWLASDQVVPRAPRRRTWAWILLGAALLGALFGGLILVFS